MHNLWGNTKMKRTTTAGLGLLAAIGVAAAQADVTVMAVRLGANDVTALAKFYEAAFGLKEIDRVGEPATEIIMRYGATVAAAKAAGATLEGDVVTVPIGGAPIKIAMLVDPDGNALEIMELPKGVDHLPH